MQSRTDRQAFVSRRRLDPGPPKRGLIEELPVGHAVQGAASRHDQVFLRHPLVQLLQEMKENFLEAMLHGVGQVHVALRDFGIRLTRLAEQVHHALGKMPRQSNRSVRLDLHSLIASQGHEVVQVKAESGIAQFDDFPTCSQYVSFP